MDSRERMFRALEFRNPDRAPRELWALPWVGMYAPEALRELQRDFPMDVWEGPRVIPKGDRATGELGGKAGACLDDWGCEFVNAEDGVVGEVKNPPLADWAAMRHFQPPWEILQRADWDAASRAQAANLASAIPRFLKSNTTVRPFERMQFLRGSQNLYLDMGYDTAEFRALRTMVHDFSLKELELWAKTDVDALSFMDDWGSQKALLISPEMWREYFKPLYADYCRIIHHAGKKAFFHSDGHIFAIYEDLIEIGVDAVNSQLFCMDIEDLARRFKGRITFWGEICRQHVLPFGTVADVRSAVARVRQALDDGRGGVIAQCEWGVRNPPQNIRAVYQAWEDSANRGQTTN